MRRDEERPRYIEDEEEEFDIRLIHNKHMVTDLDNLDDDPIGQTRDGYSSEGSVSLQRKGRLGMCFFRYAGNMLNVYFQVNWTLIRTNSSSCMRFAKVFRHRRMRWPR